LATTNAKPSEPPAANPPASQVRENEREKELAMARRIDHEALIYKTIYEAVRGRMREYDELGGTDLKDIATTIYIQTSRGTPWGR